MRSICIQITLIFSLMCGLSPKFYAQVNQIYPNNPNAVPIFGNRQNLGLIELDEISEASGIIASRKNLDVFWTHNDSGGDNVIYALNNSGEHLGVYTLDGIIIRDWEDIAIDYFPDDDEYYLFLGDIGDNNGNHNEKYIFKIPEPGVNANQNPVNESISGIETITFEYSNGDKWNSETLLIDPLNHDFYIVTKRFNAEDLDLVYRIQYPQPTTTTITAQQVAEIDVPSSVSTGCVGGDVSSNGLEILIKTYNHVYYWERTAQQSFWEAFDIDGVNVNYIQEPQGEALCWKPDRNGYYTVSEEPIVIFPAHLYFYERDPLVPVELSTFIGVFVDNQVELRWNTVTERNSYGFKIERTYNPENIKSWEEIGFIRSAGNSLTLQNYSYTDNKELLNGSVYYRLKQIDFDNSFEYSAIVEVIVDITKFSLEQNYPNPFNAETKVKYFIPQSGKVRLTLFDISGTEIQNYSLGTKEAGIHTLNFFGDKLSSGNYFYHIDVSSSFGKHIYSETKVMTLIK